MRAILAASARLCVLTPLNSQVLTDKRYRVFKVTDFGVSAWSAAEDMSIAGTPSYMAPELLHQRRAPKSTSNGKRHRRANERSGAVDVFSFAVMAAQLLSTHGGETQLWWRAINRCSETGVNVPVEEELQRLALPHELCRLVSECARFDACERPRMSVVASRLAEMRLVCTGRVGRVREE